MLQSLNPKRSTVLIVEDNPDDAIVETRALETFGVKSIFHARTAEDALAFLNTRNMDVVLIDYNLPGLNGLRLLERLRELWPEMPAIVVTGARDERVAVSAMKLGAADYVTKDDLLTSGIIRSLQTALRERNDAGAERQRETLAAGGNWLDTARAEAGWLAESMPARLLARGDDSAPRPAYGDEGWEDELDAFERYLRESFRSFPAVAEEPEGGLVRMFIERGSSPAEVLAIYRATLQSLAFNQAGAPLNPAVCLARLFAGLVGHYQRQQSLGQAPGVR
jgi:CheY-like chemotaxis protein